MISVILRGTRPTICVACYQMNTRDYERANDNGDDSAVNYNDDRDDDVDDDNETVDDDEDSGDDSDN